MELDKELDLMKETNILRGKISAMQEIKQRLQPLFILPGGKKTKELFDMIMDIYHDGLTWELENIQGKTEEL